MSARALSAAHVPALDGLRGLAILLVLIHMFAIPQPTGVSPAPGMGLLSIVSQGGWIGVQLFFVLSGYLITGGLLDTQNARRYFLNFYVRRTLRIFPLYYGILLAAFVIRPLLIIKPLGLNATAHNQIWLWTYLYNWAHHAGHEVLGFSHFWSLAVEEQFYLIWPLVVWRTPAARVVQICLALIVAALAIRVGLRLGGVNPRAVYMFTVCRMDALAAGAAVAAWIRLPAAARRIAAPALGWSRIGVGCLLTALALVPFFDQNSMVMDSIGMTLLSIGFASAVYRAGRFPSAAHRVIGWAPLRLAGRYSYGAYVFQLPLGTFVLSHAIPFLPGGPEGMLPLVYLLFATVATFAVAAVSYHAFEVRFLNLKKKIPRGWLEPTPSVIADDVAR